MKLPRMEGTALRVFTAFLWLPAVTALVWFPSLKLFFMLLVMFLSYMGAREFFGLTRSRGIGTLETLVTMIAPLLAAGAAVFIDMRLLLIACLFAVITAHLLSAAHTIAGMATSVFGLVYVGFFPAYFTALHVTPVTGPALITLLLAAIGISDTGAYVFGRWLGRHKLAPRISPNKTVEGSVAALICAGITGAVLFALKEMFHWESYPEWPLAVYVLVGVILSVAGQLGDLTESLLKRDAGVKDSGTLFPGHGGALDRCDAFLFGGPVLYHLALFIQ